MIYLVGGSEEVAEKLTEAGHAAQAVGGWPFGIETGDTVVLATEQVGSRTADWVKAYREAGIEVVIEDMRSVHANPARDLASLMTDEEADVPPGAIHFVASDRGGSGRWRSAWPATVFEDAGYRVLVEQYELWLKRYAKRVTAEDLVIAHRPEVAADWLEVQRELKHRGVTVLIDEDDDITAVPRTFPVGFRQAIENRSTGHDESIAEADGLIVSTPRLLEVFGHLNERTWVMPNLIPSWVGHTAAPPSTDGKVRVGWAGITRTHKHDLWWLKPSVRQALEGAIFTTVGDERTPKELGLNRRAGDPVEAWGPEFDVSLYYRKMSRADIGMVPLKPDEPLNWAKSNIKALEYMALGRPVVGTWLPEQTKVLDDGVSGFLARTPQEFAHYVQVLVKDEALRLDMGERAKARAEAFTLEFAGHQWFRVVADLSWRLPDAELVPTGGPPKS